MRAESIARDRYCAARWAKDLTMRKDWVIIDAETTGLRNAEIVQIGVLSGAGEVLLDSLVKPTISIPSQASIIHGITDDQVKDAPTFPEIYPHFVDAIANKAVVIYNAKFDVSILKYCCDIGNIRIPILTELHCAMHWYAKWIGDWSDYHGNYRWPKLPGGDHTVIGDCRATLKIIHMMANSLVPEAEVTIDSNSQGSSIIVPVQKANLSERQRLVKDSIQTYQSQNEQTTVTDHELEPLLVHMDKEVREDRSSSNISNDSCQIRKDTLIQGRNTVEPISKKGLEKGNEQTAEELSSCQIDNPSYIDPHQIQAYKNARELGLTRSDAANIAGFSKRTGQRIDSGDYRPNRGRVRDWATRSDPLSEVWECELVPLLQEQPKLNSVKLLDYLQQRYPGIYNASVLRTLQRRVHNWRLNQGLLQDSTPDRKKKKPDREQLEWMLEWMKRLQNGKIKDSELATTFADKLDSKDIYSLLNHVLHSSLNYRNRALTVLFYLQKIPNPLIAQFLSLSSRSIRRWIRKYEVYGVRKLLDFTRKEVKKSEDSKYIEKVFEILHSPPSSYDINRTSWTMTDLHRIMAESGLRIAPLNIRKIIRDAGYKFRNAKKVLTSTDPNYRDKLKKITQILSNLGPKDKFFSIDEFGPFSVKIQGGKSLMPPGEGRVVPQWQQSKGQLIMTAALELSTNQVTHFYSEKKDTEEMIKLLDLLIEKYADEDCIYLSWDAASWHASKELYKRVDEINSPEYRKGRKLPIVKLAPLPASSQFLNIIESVFSGMARAIIHNSDYQSVEECKGAIDRYFSERNQHFIEHPKRAGKKIWGKERVEVEFKESNNCKDPRWR